MLGCLLRIERTARRHRWRRLGVLGRLALLAGGAGVAAGAALVGDALLRPGAAGLAGRADAWSFWCMAVAAMVLGYGSFETMYRNPAARRLGPLPVSPAALYVWTALRVLRKHAPLLLLPALTGASLLVHGRLGVWLVGLGDVAAVVLFGGALAIYAHLVAGRSMLGEATPLKGLLAHGFGPPETAFLFYSPAAALAGAMSVGLLTDLALRTAVDRGVMGPLGVVVGLCAAAAAWALWRGQGLFVRDHHRIVPRFLEAEILPPWREGDLPRRYLGDRLEQHLPATLRPIYRRDLRQYRRRFRAVPVALGLAAVALVVFGATAQAEPGAAVRITLVAGALGVLLFSPVVRAAGAEIGTPFDLRALPVRRADAIRSQWLLAAMEWGPLALAAAMGALAGGLGAWALGPLLGVLAIFGASQAVLIPAAIRRAPDVGRVAWAARGGALVLLGLVQWVVRV